MDPGYHNGANGGTRCGTFHGEMDPCKRKSGAGLRHGVVCANVEGRTKNRIAQSKCVCTGLLAIAD